MDCGCWQCWPWFGHRTWVLSTARYQFFNYAKKPTDFLFPELCSKFRLTENGRRQEKRNKNEKNIKFANSHEMFKARDSHRLNDEFGERKKKLLISISIKWCWTEYLLRMKGIRTSPFHLQNFSGWHSVACLRCGCVSTRNKRKRILSTKVIAFGSSICG